MALALDLGSKAYMAGVLDMAGIIRLRPMANDNPPVPYVGLSTTNKQVADFLAGLTDSKVTITKRKYSKHNCNEHCPVDHAEVDSVSYRWSVTGVKATVVLANIRPYLVFQTEAATQALEAGYAANYKPATYRRMKLLGWDIPAEVKT
jgi:hypothetical protein